MPGSKTKVKKIFSKGRYFALIVFLIFFFGIGAGYLISNKFFQKNPVSEQKEKDIYVEFLIEVYDKIKENYWEKISDKDLTVLFKLGTEKITNSPQTLDSEKKEDLEKMLNAAMKDMAPEKKKEFSVNLAQIVLANLKPFGRNALYTTQEETGLKNMVNNINPENNLYQDLGVDKNATGEEIKKSYEEKISELSKDATPEGKEKLEKARHAFSVLSDQESKQKYDTFGVEPTVFGRLIKPDVFYIYIKRISPTTFEEFQKAAEAADKGDTLNSLILDLRGNIGGSIDILPYFLGPFIGQNQYAYEFFHQGEYTPFKTQTGWLTSLFRYKRVVILIDEQTQSSAELIVATLKKYNVGVVVGAKSRGWGTIERVFPLDHQIDLKEKFSVFLVHSLTLADDNQPIEGKGIEPVINIKDPGWEKQLFNYFHYQEFIEAVKEALESSPPE